MRKFYLFGVFGLMVLITSCSQSEEIFYSCDKTQDEWVKENLSEIRQMTRSEWLQVDMSLSHPVYRAFTPQQCINFWKDKLNETKKLPWTDEELAHIQRAEDFINSHLDFFHDELTPEQEDELELFFYKWQKYSVEQLGWSENVAIAIMATGYKLENTKGELVIPTATFSKGVMASRSENDSDDKNCHCRKQTDSCHAINLGHCTNTDCYEKRSCGWLGMFLCNGRCDESVI